MSGAHPVTERETLAHLASHGVPVAPTHVATTAAEAVAAAKAIGRPVVLKILSPDIAHKTEVGGVKLDLSGDDAVAAAFDAIQASVTAAKPDARIEGVLVSPMRRGGVELVVGLARDPQWGLVMALGLGGVWVEALQDVALRLLPVCREEVVEALKGPEGRQASARLPRRAADRLRRRRRRGGADRRGGLGAGA